MSPRPQAVLLMDQGSFASAFPPAVLARLTELVDLVLDHPVTDLADVADADLAGVEVVISGWGSASVVPHRARLPQLRAVVHSAGTVKHLVDLPMLQDGIQVSTSTALNAIPVAEFAQAAIVLALKRVPAVLPAFASRSLHRSALPQGPGAYDSVVGLIGASRVARAMKPWLDLLQVQVLVHDPYLSTGDAAELGWTPVALDALMASSDVVSVHAPSTAETRHMIGATQLAAMRDGSTLINTARGALIDHEALTAELLTGRIDAILDVTDPEPLPDDHPLWQAPNVWLTPHLAGSQAQEIARLGSGAVDEVERLVTGQPLERPVLAQTWDRIG